MARHLLALDISLKLLGSIVREYCQQQGIGFLSKEPSFHPEDVSPRFLDGPFLESEPVLDGVHPARVSSSEDTGQGMPKLLGLGRPSQAELPQVLYKLDTS